MSEGYNGWTNYETWLVNLWIDNDGFDADCRDMAAQCVKDTANESCPDGAAIRTMAEWLKEQHEENLEPVCKLPGVFGDLMNAAMSSVNWDELARHYIADATQEV